MDPCADMEFHGTKQLVYRLSYIFFQPTDAYIGLIDRYDNNRLVWEDTGGYTNYFNWDNGQPDDGFANCVKMRLNGRWDDVWCANTICLFRCIELVTHPIVCEKLIWKN